MQRVASDLQGAGLSTELLGEADLVAALGLACSVNPAVGTNPNSSQTVRSEETRRAWRVDDRWHTTFWVDKMPKLAADTTPDVLAGLNRRPGLRHRTRPQRDPRHRRHHRIQHVLRVTARTEQQLAEAAKGAQKAAVQAGMSLTRLDGEQLPGLIATIPLGGGA